jgi:hypothetical protein
MGACRLDFVFHDLLSALGIDLKLHPQQDPSSVLCMLTIVVWNSHRGETPATGTTGTRPLRVCPERPWDSD